MSTTSPKSRGSLRVNAFDRVSSLLVSLLVMTGVSVSALVFIYLATRFADVTIAIPVKPIAVTHGGGGGGDGTPGSAGESPDLLPPDAVQDPLTEREIKSTLDAVTSAVAAKTSLLANEQIEPVFQPTAPQEFGDVRRAGFGQGGEGRGPGFGSGVGSGRGPGFGGGSGGGRGRPEPQREIRFEPKNLLEYAQYLDFFKIELGVLGQDNKIYYAYNLSQRTPEVRSGDPADELRLYMNSARGRFAGLDRRLASRAKIIDRGKIILQFYPPETQAILYELERQKAESAGRKVEDVLRTVYRVARNGNRFDFQLEDQSYR